ncbi:MAG TPA: VIT1/CCC1 transporter family protein [Actinomycetota bacterium]|nr:VIT1/CCC1 transporter family protein [Actinomycetota bacterium]
MSEDLAGLEHDAAEHPERLERLGPTYDVEEHPGAHRVAGEWIRDATLGANDGLVSILTLLAGVAGAEVAGSTVLIAGLAGLVAGAISMGVGAYVSAKAYRAYYRKELRKEVEEMREKPDVEREEIRRIYRNRGFEGDLLERVVSVITSNPGVWLKVMMTEELGLSSQFGRPVGAAVVVFVAFLAGGVVPVLPFLWAEGLPALLLAFALTAAALLAAGGVRSRFTGEAPLKAGFELVAMAAVGVGAANLIGRLVGVAVPG